MNSALKITALHKSFKSEFLRKTSKILDGISLQVERGEIFGYLGPNGAGKTTTIKCILGLIFPDSGEIEILGQPHLSLKAKAGLGYLPENPYFYDYLTAREFLRFYSRLNQRSGGETENRITALLQLVGLERSADLQLRKYSKGMLQRIGLAQAVLNDPELVLLDEPLGGLDPLGRKEIRDIIIRLKEEGKTVFLSSHILQDIEMVCDRVAMIAAGRIISQGHLHDLISQKVILTEITLSGIDKNKLQKFGECLTAEGDRILLKVRKKGQVGQVLELAKSSGAVIHSLVPRTETLEDIFVGMVSQK